jgi:diguanylate cyclase (GGDEF)-like protein
VGTPMTADFYLLYAVPVCYLALRYLWPGALAGLLLVSASYATTVFLLMSSKPAARDELAPALVYFLLLTIVMGLLAEEQERSRRALERMHTTAREQVRRLEAIGRITALLNTAPTSADVARVIAEGAHEAIAFKNCRVHMVEQEDGAAPSLRLVAFFGTLIGRRTLPADQLRLRVGEGITGWVAQHGQPLLIGDATQDPRAEHIAGTERTPNSLLAAPLLVNGATQGVIVLSQEGANAFSGEDLHMMTALANAAGIALANIASRESLARQAVTDPLTGLGHHAAFQGALAAAVAQSAASGAPLALALLDIDGFRGYNERAGLAAGDAALRQVGARLAAICRTAGGAQAGLDAAPARPFRIGGDEFALLMTGPFGTPEQAVALTQACLQPLAADGAGEPATPVSLSAGLALCPADATSRYDLLDTAEAALYLVRQTGGGRLGLADAAAKEALTLRRTLEAMVQASLAQSGSPAAAPRLVAQAVSLTEQSRHRVLAQQLTAEALRALAAAIDAKDDYTRGHSERVAATAGEIAASLELPGDEVEQISMAARMHDIGKIGVPDQVLHKRGPLTRMEQAVVATHPDLGAQILEPISTLRPLVPIVRHHHEHFDGCGYPDGLEGDAIPLGACVVAVADAIDAMVTDRPYRRGMLIGAALTELQKWAGSHYDPQVVAAAATLYGPGGAGLALRGVLPSVVGASPPAPDAPDLAAIMRPEPITAPGEAPALPARQGEQESAHDGAG